MNIWTVLKRFSEDKLPAKCEISSSLKYECISEKGYSHSIIFWNTFKINTIGDYHDLYLKTEVLLSVDVSEMFINRYLEYCRLDLCHYISSPWLSWDGCLN